MGIYPSSFTQFFDATVHAMVESHTAALAAPKLAGIAP
jgi:NADH-quinone oxidoreductase subunit M